MFQISRTKLLFGGLLILMAGTACYRFELGSIWAEEPITIDGDDSEWTLPRRVLEGEQGVIGFMNDDTYLYISFRTSSRARIQEIVTQGLTLWIDPKGGTSKRIGFRYPIGSKPLGISPWDYDPRPRTTGYQAFLEQLLLLQPGIEILGSRKGDVAVVPLDNQVGLQLKVQLTKDLFVYEMRVPYGRRSSLPRPIGAAPGQKIGIGIIGGPLQAYKGAKRQDQSGARIDDPVRPVLPGREAGDKMDRPGAGVSEIWISVTLATER